MRHALAALIAASLVALSCRAAAQETDGAEDTGGVELPDWLELDAEYRMRMQYLRPLDLSGDAVRETDWTEHRARIHFGLVHDDWLAIRTRIDVLDQVLWGDNGRIGREVEPISGASVATHQPNNATLGVGLPPGADPLAPDSYRPVLTSADPLQVDLLYGDVVLPIGLLRIGRQPSLGQGITGHDGEAGNRWGVASYADAGDRIFFATKVDEAVRLIRSGGEHQLDTSQERGVFLAGWYELADQGDPNVAFDNLRQLGVAAIWRQPEFGGVDAGAHDVEVTVAAVNVGGDDFETDVWAVPIGLRGSFGPVDIDLSASILRGQTREISEGFAELARIAPQLQDVRAQGARGVIDWQVGPVTLTLEGDWASGDDDPRPGSPLTVFGFPRDLNVGLLLFERIIAYESARSAAVGVENLRNLDAATFPLTEVATDGRFTNAVALFPQVLVDWVDSPEHRLHTRVGALFAWPDVGLVDPVITMLSRDGNRIDDDAVNYHGGDPGTYYGTELDLQVGWTYRGRFAWIVEAATLFPGNSLEDENGDAVNAFMVENRFELRF